MAMTETALFSYIAGSSPFHKLYAEIKVFLLVFCPPLLFLTNIPACGICMILIIVFSKLCGICFKLQLRDIKPILIYCIFLLFVGFFSSTYTYFFTQSPEIVSSHPLVSFLKFSIPPKKTQLLILHLVCTMQFTSLFFKTTTSLSLKEALENIEKKVSFGKSSGKFSQTFSLFLNFIPTVFSVWKQIELSWKARNGKNGLSKYIALLPVFISVSLQKAYKTYLALENRKQIIEN